MTEDRNTDAPGHEAPAATATELAERAYAAFDRGDLLDARSLFDALLECAPDDPDYHYMQGLVCKYLRDWAKSLSHNLCCLDLRGEADDADEAAHWNAAIAATAIGDWAEARRQWARCGIDIPGDAGPISGRFGVASLRLDAWGRGETLFARRIDPVRAQLINVPLPDSGYRFGDIVLHDGAATGQRRFHQSMVPVLNALQRLQTSEFPTFAVFVDCPTPRDLEDLLAARVPGIAETEDWTESLSHLCLRCSYGTPHRHARPASDVAPDAAPNASPDTAGDGGAWRRDRSVGIAAQSRHSVTRLLEAWKAKGRGRRIEGVESRDHAPTAPPGSGRRWWLSPEDGDDAADGEGN